MPNRTLTQPPHLEHSPRTHSNETQRNTKSHIKMTVAAIALAALETACCATDNQPQRQDAPVSTIQGPTSSNEAGEMLFAHMPITSAPVPYRDYLRIEGFSSPQELHLASRRLGINTEKIINNSRSDLRNTGSGRIKTIKNILREIVKAALEEPIFKNNPQIQKMTDEQVEKNPYGIAGALQTLFLPGGYWFALQNTGEFNPQTGGVSDFPELNFTSISNIEKITFEDSKGKVDVNVATVGKKVYRDKDDISGLYQPRINIGMIDEQGIVSNEEKRLKPLYEFQLIPTMANREEMRKQYLIDTKNHEATHVFIGLRFPKFGKETEFATQFQVQLDYPLIGSKRVNLSGSYGPVQFQELCGVGNELYQSNATIPESMYQFIGSGSNNPTSGYHLVSKLLPAIVLNVAPDSNQKTQIIQKMLAGDGIKPVEICEMVRDTFQPHHIKTVGAKLYAHGYELLEQAESGKLKRLEQ